MIKDKKKKYDTLKKGISPDLKIKLMSKLFRIREKNTLTPPRNTSLLDEREKLIADLKYARKESKLNVADLARKTEILILK